MIIPICRASGLGLFTGDVPCGKCDRCEAMGYTDYPPPPERQPFNHAEYLKLQADKPTIVEQ